MATAPTADPATINLDTVPLTDAIAAVRQRVLTRIVELNTAISAYKTEKATLEKLFGPEGGFAALGDQPATPQHTAAPFSASSVRAAVQAFLAVNANGHHHAIYDYLAGQYPEAQPSTIVTTLYGALNRLLTDRLVVRVAHMTYRAARADETPPPNTAHRKHKRHAYPAKLPPLVAPTTTPLAPVAAATPTEAPEDDGIDTNPPTVKRGPYRKIIGNDTKALIELMAASPNRIFKVADLNKHLNANPAYDKPQHHVNNLMSTLKRNKFVVKIARGQYRINRTKLGTVKFETPKHATP